MYNFVLTNAVSENLINSYFLKEIRYSRNGDILQKSVDFNQIIVDIPNNPWGGGLSNYSRQLFGYQQLYNFFNANPISLAFRLDFGNVFLDDTDFFNTYNKIILEQGQNGSTVIEISNLQLYEYIKTNFPLYRKFILSPNAWQIIDITPEIVNVICENEDFALISLPYFLNNNQDFLEQLKYKQKIEITVNPLCPYECLNYGACVQSENEINHSFSEKTILKTCNKRFRYENNPQIMTLDNLKEKYVTKGITHFRLAEFPIIAENDFNYLIFLAKYFIKEEYQQGFIQKFLQTI